MRVVDDEYRLLARTGWRGRIVEDRLRTLRAEQERARLVREVRAARRPARERSPGRVEAGWRGRITAVLDVLPSRRGRTGYGASR